MGHYDCKSCDATPYEEHSPDCERFGTKSPPTEGTDMNQIETVARALCDDAGCVWDHDPQSLSRIEWRKAACAAIAAWNTRASDAEITRLTEALRAAEERETALREALFNATALIGHSVPMDTTALVAGEQLTAQGVWLQGRDALAGAKPC